MLLLQFRTVFIMLLALYYCGDAAAETLDPFQTAKAELDKIFGDKYAKYINEVIAGDLNKDGVEDLSILIITSDTHHIAVLFGSPNGYKLAAISKSFCRAKYHYNLEVRSQSLFIMVVHSLAPSSDTYQFSVRNRELVLIGQEEENWEKEQSDGYGKSINYLTHQVNHWRHTGPKKKSVKKPFAKSPPVPLNGFDCEIFEEPGGWINDDFGFEP